MAPRSGMRTFSGMRPDNITRQYYEGTGADREFVIEYFDRAPERFPAPEPPAGGGGGAGGRNTGGAGGTGAGTIAGAGGTAAGTETPEAATARVAARDALRTWLATFFGEDTEEGRQALQFLDDQIKEFGPRTSVIRLNMRQQDFYKTRFRGNAARRAAGLPEYTEEQYITAENTYAETLRRFGLERLATRQVFGDLITGLVSTDELAERVSTVYDRIQNADAPLRAELQRLKGTANLTDQDLAESLLLGKEGAQSLQRKIRQAEIRSEASMRGLTSQLSDVELERRGITRAQAAAGFEQVATEMPAFERLSQIYERQAPAPAQQLQTELESEALLGQASQRRRRLMTQEVAAFSGAAGTTPTLASRARAGQF